MQTRERIVTIKYKKIRETNEGDLPSSEETLVLLNKVTFQKLFLVTESQNYRYLFQDQQAPAAQNFLNHPSSP